MVFNPVSGALALTILVAVIFMIEGAFEVGLAFDLRPEPGWGWTLFSAVISILAGVLIAAGLPGTSLFVLGLLLRGELVVALRYESACHAECSCVFSIN